MISLKGIFSGNFTHTEGSMSQHLSTVDITWRIDTWNRRFHVFINLDPSTIQFKLNFTDTFKVWNTTDWEKGFIRDDIIFSFNLDTEFAIFFNDFLEFSIRQDCHTFTFKD